MWEKTFGGSSYDGGYSVQQTSDGGYIVAGETDSYGDSDGDVYLIKTDANGNLQWQKTFGGTNWDNGKSVQQTSDGGYIVAGWTYSYGAGNSDIYLIKTDANGDLMWEKTFGGSSYDGGNSVQQTSDGGYIIAGDTCSYGAGSYDVYLIKLKPEGAPANQPPVASFTFTPESPVAWQEITFDASASSDPDGQIISCRWDFGDDTTGEGLTVTHAYNQSGTYTVALTVTDNQGATGSQTQTVVVLAGDTIPPAVISTDPANGATDVPVDKIITITFSKDIQPGSAYDSIPVKDTAGNAVAVSKSISGQVLTIKPNTNLTYGTAYVVTIPAGAVQDLAGNALANDYTFSFTTQSAAFSSVTGNARCEKRTDHSGVVVTLEGTDALAGTKYTATTPADGLFSFTGLEPGTYILTASLPGFLKAGRTVTVAAYESIDVGELLLLAGDISSDNVVDIDDLLILKRTYGTTQGEENYNPTADFNANGRVDLIDLILLARNYTKEGFAY